MKLLGWTLGQWAEVAAAHTFAGGPTPAADFDGARKLQCWWRLNRMTEPGEHRIIEVAHDMDFSYASKMLDRVLVQLTDKGYYFV